MIGIILAELQYVGKVVWESITWLLGPIAPIIFIALFIGYRIEKALGSPLYYVLLHIMQRGELDVDDKRFIAEYYSQYLELLRYQRKYLEIARLQINRFWMSDNDLLDLLTEKIIDIEIFRERQEAEI